MPSGARAQATGAADEERDVTVDDTGIWQANFPIRQDDVYTGQDIRFTQSKDGKTLYAFTLAPPTDNEIVIKSLATRKYKRGLPSWMSGQG